MAKLGDDIDDHRAMKFRSVYGVDFSGAREPGKTLWVARAKVARGRCVLQTLDSIDRLAKRDDRVGCLAWLVEAIRNSDAALWGIDFPFALPLEIVPKGSEQLKWLAEHPGDAYVFGRDCVAIARTLGEKMHLRRQTDVETKTPFDCYHYRIVCQTFHGMRDVLAPLWNERHVAIVPFQYDRMVTAKVVVAEACPGSTLKRLGLQHNRYKQTGRKPPTEAQRLVRRKIFAGLRELIEVPPHLRRKAMIDPGGDALDAIVAAAGVLADFRTADHEAIAAHPRYPLEGRIYA